MPLAPQGRLGGPLPAVVFPVITWATGERIYDGHPDVSLEMPASRTFDDRIQLLEYVPTVLSARLGGRLEFVTSSGLRR